MNAVHIELIHDLLRACDPIDLPIWLESGWAVDARLGVVTREHDDVDLAIPAERMDAFVGLLRERGAGDVERTDYGFLVQVDGVLLDCEPCVRIDGAYELDEVPPGACPMAKEGVLAGVPVRCTSWQAILWEYFFYLDEVPFGDWPAKDVASYRRVREAVGGDVARVWHDDYGRRRERR